MKLKIIISVSFFVLGVVTTLFLLKFEGFTESIVSNIDIFTKLMGMFFSVATTLIAFYALNSWRQQIRSSGIFELATQYESDVTRLTMLTTGGCEITEQAEFARLFKDISFRSLSLKQREFSLKPMDNILDCINEMKVSMTESKYISNETSLKMHSYVNQLSEEINSVFSWRCS
tara:strand:+ start:28450 stop:28971 length:522 start_codon:yes stop_codon:yes gene_type:complete